MAAVELVRRIDHRGRGIGLVVQHRIEPLRCAARSLDRVIALVEAVVLEHLVEQQPERGIGRVDHHRLAAQVGVGLDLRLHEDVVEAIVAAGHDDDVALGKLDHRHRIIDAGMRDLILALGDAFAHRVRSRRVDELDRQAVLGEQAFVLRGENREIGEAGEYDHLQWRRVCACIGPNMAPSATAAIIRQRTIVSSLCLLVELSLAPSGRILSTRSAPSGPRLVSEHCNGTGHICTNTLVSRALR